MEQYFLMFCDEPGNFEPIKPIYILKPNDIDGEGNVSVNGEEVPVFSENTNFYNDNCQPGDLVFEVSNEYAFYRKGMGAPAGFMNNNAIVGTEDEVEKFEDDSIHENIVKLNEDNLRYMIAESVKRILPIHENAIKLKEYMDETMYYVMDEASEEVIENTSDLEDAINTAKELAAKHRPYGCYVVMDDDDNECFRTDEASYKFEGIERGDNMLQETEMLYYPGLEQYYPETGELAGDMSYEFNDARDLAEPNPETIIKGIKDYFINDYPEENEERYYDCVPVFYVDTLGSYGEDSAPERLYISSMDSEYAEDIKRAFSKKYYGKNIAIETVGAVKLNGDDLRNMIKESVKRILKEWNAELNDDEDEKFSLDVLGYSLENGDIQDLTTGNEDVVDNREEAINVIKHECTYPKGSWEYDVRYANNMIPVFCIGGEDIFYISSIDAEYKDEILQKLKEKYALSPDAEIVIVK